MLTRLRGSLGLHYSLFAVVLFGFLGRCSEPDWCVSLGHHFGGVSVGGAPGTWCEFLKVGLMASPTRITVSTNGVVVAHMRAGEGSFSRYETSLTAEQMRYLGTVLRVGRIVEKPQIKSPNHDTQFFFWVREGDRTKLLDPLWPEEDRDLIPLFLFMHKLVVQAHGMTMLRQGSVYEAMRETWLQPTEAIGPLKEYLKKPRTPEGVHYAWLALSKVLTPEDWAGYIDHSLREASLSERKVVLAGLTNPNRVTEFQSHYRYALGLVLKDWMPSRNTEGREP